MNNEDSKKEGADFQDFADDTDILELDVDIAQADEDAVERALKNIAAQMAGAPDDVQEFSLESQEKQQLQTQDEQQQIQEEAKDIENEIQAQAEVEKTDEEVKEDVSSEIQTEISKEAASDTVSGPSEENIQEDLSDISEKDESADDKIADLVDVPVENNIERLSQWEELNSENDVVKKYIVYISKDFVPLIDNLSTDERSAYINDAIQLKLDFQDEKKQIANKKTATLHFVIAIIIILALTPVALFLANKAIMVTFENYKYSQENFEKLYRQRFEKNKAFMRSLQYNKELERKAKNNASEKP